jgi:hypothetical protein
VTPEESTARVLLVLRHLPGCRAPWAALRRILKVLLRSFAWKCIRAELLPASAKEVSREEASQLQG